MNDTDSTPNRDYIVAALRELVEALDRRVPHVERLGEVRIAREAAALRREAAKRVKELTPAQESERSDAPPADDGGHLHSKE